MQVTSEIPFRCFDNISLRVIQSSPVQPAALALPLYHLLVHFWLVELSIGASFIRRWGVPHPSGAGARTDYRMVL